MARGKQTCKILKEIRQQIAEANGIEFVTSECRFKGDCLGTCPKCEAEVRYLEQQLRARSLAGKAITLAGISAASLAMLMPITSHAQSPSHNVQMHPCDSISATRVNSVKVRGIVTNEYKTQNDSIATEGLIGALVVNLTNGKGTATDIDGRFEIETCKGDSLQVSYIGYAPKTVCVNSSSDTIQITFTEDESTLKDEVVFVGAFTAIRDTDHYLDLNVLDENGKAIDSFNLNVERVWINKDGDEDSELVSPEYFNDKHPCRIYWDDDEGLQDDDGKPLKEATLRIEADGYDDPVTIKVKYPKRNAKKTIKFKHKKE